MKTHKDIEEEVMKTLDSLDDVQDIEVNPYFYTRLQAKIQEVERQKARSPGRLFGSAQLRLAGIIALVVINIVSFVSLFQIDERQASVSAFADEYGLTQDYSDLFE